MLRAPTDRHIKIIRVFMKLYFVFHFLRPFLLLALMLFISACAEESAEPDANQGIGKNGSSDIEVSYNRDKQSIGSIDYALSVNGRKIPLSEIDALIELKLFDLEWARYELRKAALSDYLEIQQDLLDTRQGEQAANTIEVLLSPPVPPRLELSAAQHASALAFSSPQMDQAPVRLSVFCNYQSSHCARMQPIYQQLVDEYGQAIAFEFFDFPQAFHHFAVSASNAARCAHAMGEFEAFHKALWVNQLALSKETYLRIAKQLKLDEKLFSSCLQSESHLVSIQAHAELAKSFGFNNVPVTLVNGLYLYGPKTLEVFRYYIDLELIRLGYQGSRTVLNSGITASQDDVGDSARQEQSLPDDNEQASVETAEQGAGLPEDMPDQEDLEYKARAVVPPVGETPLSREWIEDQLLQQAELEAHFQAAEHEVEGVRLTKLSGVEQSEFYQTLGLQEGDVLMRVNEQWVHEAQNTLFESLETGTRVSVVLVRRGLPVQLVYTIQD